jgi:predicted RNA-binding Zn-ribbon protein involved in translation (DUF1610 family)
MLEWLRRVKMARHGAAPEAELLAELFRAAAVRFVCRKCGAVGLSVSEADEGDDEAWGMARKCEGCGRPIARERLDVFPETRLCVECQRKIDAGETLAPAEYCPRCGSVMTLRASRRGVTRYVMACPKCKG